MSYNRTFRWPRASHVMCLLSRANYLIATYKIMYLVSCRLLYISDMIWIDKFKRRESLTFLTYSSRLLNASFVTENDWITIKSFLVSTFSRKQTLFLTQLGWNSV